MAETKTTTKKSTTTKTSSKKEVKGSTATKSAKKETPKTQASSEEFAVIETGGKQYKVSVGDSIFIEKLGDDMNEGDKIVFDKVLLVDNGKDTTIGTPYITKATVEGVLEKQGKGKKITAAKYKAKSRYFKQYGHRQPYMKVKIEAIK